MKKEIVEKDFEPFNTRNVVKTLERLMIEVTEKQCTPETVAAACNCASRVTDILKVHIEAERLKHKLNAMKN